MTPDLRDLSDVDRPKYGDNIRVTWGNGRSQDGVYLDQTMMWTDHGTEYVSRAYDIEVLPEPWQYRLVLADMEEGGAVVWTRPTEAWTVAHPWRVFLDVTGEYVVAIDNGIELTADPQLRRFASQDEALAWATKRIIETNRWVVGP